MDISKKIHIEHNDEVCDLCEKQASENFPLISWCARDCLVYICVQCITKHLFLMDRDFILDFMKFLLEKYPKENFTKD